MTRAPRTATGERDVTTSASGRLHPSDVIRAIALARWTDSAPVDWRYAIGFAIALGLLAAALVAALRPPATTSTITHVHTRNSFILALNWAYCGKYSVWPPKYDSGLPRLLAATSTLNVPISSLPDILAGSRENYCESVTSKIVNNENSLMLLDAAYMFMHPNGTIRDLDRAMRRLQWLLFLPFVAVALRAGASLLLAFGIWLAADVTLLSLNDAVSCSAYGFLGPATAGMLALVSIANDRLPRSGASGMLATGLAMGLVADFVVNLRTSYTPLVAGCLALGTVCAARALGQRALRGGCLAIAGTVAGCIAFHLVFIAPINPGSSSGSSSTEHFFYHPLVLGLANPANELARDEGIEWADDRGLTLAMRADPQLAGADSFDSVPANQYEAALRSYYLGLWRERTQEMVGVYWLKWRASTKELFRFIRSDVPEPLRTIGLLPAGLLANGMAFSASFLLVGLAAILLCRPATLVVTTLVAATSAVLILLGLESAIILSGFYLSHQSALLLFTLIAALTAVQALVNALASGLTILTRRIGGDSAPR